MNRFELRLALRRQPGLHKTRDLRAQHGVSKNKLYAVLREMRKAGEVVKWGPNYAAVWQVIEPGKVRKSPALWDKWGWPDPALWPVAGVPLGYVGR